MIKPQPIKIGDYFYLPKKTSFTLDSEFILDKCRYQVGQKIFVKEKFCRAPEILYRADCDLDQDFEWSNASYMATWASRLFPVIKEIRVERLADISEEDAIAEGIEKLYGYHNSTFPEKYDFVFQDYRAEDCMTHNPKQSFSTLWNATHKKPEEKFEANPWVWVVSFEIINN